MLTWQYADKFFWTWQHDTECFITFYHVLSSLDPCLSLCPESSCHHGTSIGKWFGRIHILWRLGFRDCRPLLHHDPQLQFAHNNCKKKNKTTCFRKMRHDFSQHLSHDFSPVHAGTVQERLQALPGHSKVEFLACQSDEKVMNQSEIMGSRNE